MQGCDTALAKHGLEHVATRSCMHQHRPEPRSIRITGIHFRMRSILAGVRTLHVAFVGGRDARIAA